MTYVRRAAGELPPAPWPARRALDFCAELALALAPVHEAGAAHGALRPAAVAMRPDGGPLIHAPCGDGDSADDLHGLGIVLLSLLTGRSDPAGVLVAGQDGPAADAAALLQGLLASGAGRALDARAREVAASLATIAAAVEDTSPAAPRPSRRRARLVTALVLLVVAGAAGGYLVGHRVGPPGPALSPTTVTVPGRRPSRP